MGNGHVWSRFYRAPAHHLYSGKAMRFVNVMEVIVNMWRRHWRDYDSVTHANLHVFVVRKIGSRIWGKHRP